MKKLFEQTSSYWVRYDRYELRKTDNGRQYITPASGAVPQVYDPLRDAQTMVLGALNAGMLCMGRKPESEIQQAVMDVNDRAFQIGSASSFTLNDTCIGFLYDTMVADPIILKMQNSIVQYVFKKRRNV